MNELKDTAKKVADKEHSQQKTMQYCSIELYTETESYDFNKVFKRIKKYCEKNGSQYVAMLHDSDFYSENTFNDLHQLVGTKGQKKANHYHVLISFKYRVLLSDIAVKFGIEERWIKILKKSIDFDNMIVYLTHIKYDESVKHHYSPSLFDSNITDYCQFIYDHAISVIESNNVNICTSVSDWLNTNIHRVKMNQVMAFVLKDYDLNDYNKYYRIIKDLVIDHNQKMAMQDDNKAIREHLHLLQDKLHKAQINNDAWAKENMRLRGISVDDAIEKGSFWD